jgi:hypothetical protein
MGSSYTFRDEPIRAHLSARLASARKKIAGQKQAEKAQRELHALREEFGIRV